MKPLPSVFIVDDDKIYTYLLVSSSIDAADARKAAGYAQVSNFYIKPISQATLAEILQL